MKQGTIITRVVVLVLFLAVIAYLGVYVWQGILADPYQTVISYTYEMDDGEALDGFIVRREQMIPGETYLSQVLPQEGEKVRVGAAVAAVYASGAALRDQREIQSLELQLEQLNYAMRRNDSVADVSRLDSQLVETLTRLRGDLSAGDLGSLEEDGLALRSLVVKRTGDQSTTAGSLAALQAAADRVEGRIAALRAAAEGQVRYITVEESGTFSGLADGYESILTPERLETMTAAELDSLLLSDTAARQPQNAVGKLITGGTWYFAASISDSAAKRLDEGKKYTLAFTGDFREEVRMTLERLGPGEGGRRLAVFSSDHALERVTLARQESATLVFQRFTGVRVPDRALRVRENEDGTTTLGVYARVGRQAEFKPVEIVREGEGFYLLRGTAENRKVLRPGDVIILSNKELYNGKVIA